MNINQALDRLRGGDAELNAIADAIEAAMREKETWLSPEAYDELMQERRETLHEMQRLKSDLHAAECEIEDLRDSRDFYKRRCKEECGRIARAALNTEGK